MSGAQRELVEWGKALVIALVLAFLLRTFVLQPYRVDGYSMEPSLHNEDRLFINHFVYRLREPRHGDVVVIDLPNEGISIIKRVIGVPGDEVAVHDGFVWLNGVKLVESYLDGPTLGECGPVIVPEGSVFVMGDNRQDSRDSRSHTIGFVSYEQILGQAFLIFWPPTSIGTIPR